MTNPSDTDRVTRRENDEAGGHALTSEAIFNAQLHRTRALRRRQAAYLATLPTDSEQAIDAALALLNPDLADYPPGVEDALHLSAALRALVLTAEADTDAHAQEAMLWIAERIAAATQRTADQIDRVTDILRNPARQQFEAGQS